MFNNPLRYTDPSGHNPIIPILLVFVAIFISGCTPDASSPTPPVATPTPTPRQTTIQDAIDREDYQGAIDLASELYGINSPIHPEYSATLEGRGLVDIETCTSLIGPEAFSSPAMLVATLAHESIHVDQLLNGRWYIDPIDEIATGIAMNEVEADDWVLNNATSLELTPDVIRSIDSHRFINWYLLEIQQQQQADRGNYILPDHPILQPPQSCMD